MLELFLFYYFYQLVMKIARKQSLLVLSEIDKQNIKTLCKKISVIRHVLYDINAHAQKYEILCHL